MNKVIFGLILAVCVLGMALLMLNERLGRKPETQPVASAPRIITEQEVGLSPEPPAAVQSAPENPAPRENQAEMSAEMALAAREYEEREAREALGPPPEQEIIPTPHEPEDIEEKSQPSPIQVPGMEETPAPPQEIERKPQPKTAPGQEARQETPRAEKAAPRKEAPKPAKGEQPKPQKQARGEGNITRFVVFSRENGATIRISGDRTMKYKTINLENPDRIVIDIDGNWKFPPKLEVPRNALVNTARVGKNGDKTRLVIDLKEKPRVSRYLPSKNSDSLDVRVDK